ncbi:DUF4105 domain-containing protein [Catenovulum sp. SM1970]|uniref:Lnb N-terminal periplasmic domain-containing protein n=1 Tax=Marinifaba aquimaris TaxID=2741323 RepID=UPI0015721EC2|nr:DUF4105 domain-containing protein [Marinifaba aquimaris]NTS77587.1 DUF4105 domain-containing protein [Marinifaba aquimaris]
MRSALLFLLTFCCFHSFAFSTSTDLKQLAQDPKWAAMLHYSAAEPGEQAMSFVDDDDFFLAPNGVSDLYAELQASIKQLIAKPELQCLFPGRTLWLSQVVNGFKDTLPSIDCPEYQDWRKRVNTDSVVLVFASSQLNSPSSMYGHTFFRFDPPNVKAESTYLSYALNFGANLPADAGGIGYAIKGLTGGYPGYFAANPYFEKIKEYTRTENRDMWEYKLDLSDSEIDLLMAHVWEMRDINFDYFFFDENCSFRLLELIDVVQSETDLSAQFPGTATPIDTVRAFEAANLIKETNYRPSVMTQLEFQLAQLNEEQRALTHLLAYDLSIMDSERFKQQDKASQQLVIDSAYRYLRYKSIGNFDDKSINKRSFKLLKSINKTQFKKVAKAPAPKSPEKGHKTGLMALSAGDSAGKAFVDMTYRTTYHDLLDPILGYPDGMSLNMGKLVVRAIGDDIKLQQAELLDITSLSARNLFLSPLSWQTNVGLERQWTKGKDTLVAQGRAGVGVTYELIANSQLFAMVTARLEYNDKLKNELSIAPGWQAGYRQVFEFGNLLIESKKHFVLDDFSRFETKLAQSFDLKEQGALIIEWQYNKVDDESFNEASLQYRYYF